MSEIEVREPTWVVEYTLHSHFWARYAETNSLDGAIAVMLDQQGRDTVHKWRIIRLDVHRTVEEIVTDHDFVTSTLAGRCSRCAGFRANHLSERR